MPAHRLRQSQWNGLEARRRRSLGRTGEPGKGYSWDEVSIATQMLGAIRQLADTLVGKQPIELGSVCAGDGLSRSCTQSLCCDRALKWLSIDIFGFFVSDVVNSTRCC